MKSEQGKWILFFWFIIGANIARSFEFKRLSTLCCWFLKCIRLYYKVDEIQTRFTTCLCLPFYQQKIVISFCVLYSLFQHAYICLSVAPPILLHLTLNCSLFKLNGYCPLFVLPPQAAYLTFLFVQHDFFLFLFLLCFFFRRKFTN